MNKYMISLQQLSDMIKELTKKERNFQLSYTDMWVIAQKITHKQKTLREIFDKVRKFS